MCTAPSEMVASKCEAMKRASSESAAAREVKKSALGLAAAPRSAWAAAAAALPRRDAGRRKDCSPASEACTAATLRRVSVKERLTHS
jgi:hypothetical protein